MLKLNRCPKFETQDETSTQITTIVASALTTYSLAGLAIIILCLWRLKSTWRIYGPLQQFFTLCYLYSSLVPARTHYFENYFELIVQGVCVCVSVRV